jgi:hypothetical protein
MSGTPLTLFNNFVESTGPAYIKSDAEIINDAQLHRTYSIASLMAGQRGKKMMYDGGSEIRFSTFFETGGRARFHQPGATQNWAQPQKAVHGRAAHRYVMGEMTWNLQAAELNLGSSPDFQKYFDYKAQLEQMAYTDIWDFMESSMWAEPDFTEMESLAGGAEGKFYSVPAFINEYTNGLYNTSGGAGTAWTTLHGLDPASTDKAQNRFQQQTAVYSNSNTLTTQSSLSSILGAFEKMWKQVHFEKPPTHGDAYSNPAYNNQQIFCSPEGQTAYTSTLRAFQDQFVIEGRQDPAYPDPAFNFIPVKYVNALTTATLYPNNVTAVGSSTDNIAEGTNASTGNRQGPRFYWVNSNYLHPFFHKDYFFARGGVREHFNDPDTFVVPIRIWGNLMCTSRIRQGLVRPSGALFAGLYS